MATTSKPTIRVKTKDGGIFTLDVEVAKHSDFLREMLESLSSCTGEGDEAKGSDDDLELSEVISAATFVKIQSWMDHQHKAHGAPVAISEEAELLARFTEDIPDWDQKFLQGLDQSSLFRIIMAADYLHIKKLFGYGCKIIAESLKGKSVETIRALYGIENDFSPEEEKAIKKQTAWCDDAENVQ